MGKEDGRLPPLTCGDKEKAGSYANKFDCMQLNYLPSHSDKASDELHLLQTEDRGHGKD